jgi:cbb3-type cytochrome oxidase maturation protein
MNILLVLIPVTGLVVLIAVALFFWAVSHQQFGDLESPAALPLLEDDAAQPASDHDAAEPDSGDSPGDDVPRVGPRLQ